MLGRGGKIGRDEAGIQNGNERHKGLILGFLGKMSLTRSKGTLCEIFKRNTKISFPPTEH